MCIFPLSILALAAGILLLIKVKKENLGILFQGLSWLVILLALGYMLCFGFRAWHHRHEMGGCGYGSCGNGGQRMGHCMMMKERCEMREGKDSAWNMAGCHIQGDSVIMDKEACEKAIGKEACDKMCKDRGRCIMSKDECTKMCHTDGGSCMHEDGGCGYMHGGCCGMHRSCCGGGHGGCGNESKEGCSESKEKCSGEKSEKKACCKK